MNFVRRRSEDEAQVLNELVTKNKSGYGLDLKVAEVPEVLKKVGGEYEAGRVTVLTDDELIKEIDKTYNKLGISLF